MERSDPWSVGAWMSPNPLTVTPETLARDAFIQMRQAGFRHLVVCEADKKVLGVVTDRDLRRPTISNEPDGWNDYYQLDDSFEVRHLMTEKVISARTKDTLEKALKHLVGNKINALPVLNKNEELIGILTTHDVLRAFQTVLAENGELLRKD